MDTRSAVPRIVNAWRADLESKGRKKLAGSIASPDDHADLFEEGWAEALAREEELYGPPQAAVNGHVGTWTAGFLFRRLTCAKSSALSSPCLVDAARVVDLCIEQPLGVMLKCALKALYIRVLGQQRCVRLPNAFRFFCTDPYLLTTASLAVGASAASSSSTCGGYHEPGFHISKSTIRSIILACQRGAIKYCPRVESGHLDIAVIVIVLPVVNPAFVVVVISSRWQIEARNFCK